jgi:hypothetical protein
MSDDRMTTAAADRLLARLAELHAKCRADEPWMTEREPHGYPDGTTHFTHVCRPVWLDGKRVANVRIARHVTPDLAELLVLMRNNLPQLIDWARAGLRI